MDTCASAPGTRRRQHGMLMTWRDGRSGPRRTHSGGQGMARVSERFMEALQHFEETNDVEPLLDLFAEDGEALNLGRTEPARGRDDVRAFWLDYRAVFQRVRSEFT